MVFPSRKLKAAAVNAVAKNIDSFTFLKGKWKIKEVKDPEMGFFYFNVKVDGRLHHVVFDSFIRGEGV